MIGSFTVDDLLGILALAILILFASGRGFLILADLLRRAAE
jgi:hypothetical protein